MKIVAAKEGKVTILQADIPEMNKRHVQVRTEYSGISPGTEMSAIKRSGESPVYLGYSAVGIVEQTEVKSEILYRETEWLVMVCRM